MNRKCDVLIIGAGILGCFAARSLCRYALDIMVIEQREDVCCGISKANTGIIYRGYDQHPGSLKAQLCAKASLSFPALCRELDVRYRKCGLLMLSSGPNADRVLYRKLRQGRENGVFDIRILDSAAVYDLEPALCGGITGALYSENTFTVNPWELGIAAFENASANHVPFFFHEKAMTIHRFGDGFLVETEHHTYEASRLLLCGGHSSDRLWETVASPKVRILPLAADYLVFDRSVGDLIHHVISMEPEEKGEGITLVPTADGNILAGPTRRKLSAVPDQATSLKGITELKEKCAKLVPDLPMDRIIRSFATARPNPYRMGEDGTLSSESLNDFVILEEAGLFAMIGVKTPGITCAHELGSYITQRILHSLKDTPPLNPSFSPERKGITRTKDLLDRSCPLPDTLPEEYYEIICRCEQISKGEILEAIRRGAVTIDGVKRRTGAGMGRCQGGYCMEKILHLLSSCTGRNIYEINKDGPGSEVLIRS